MISLRARAHPTMQPLRAMALVLTSALLATLSFAPALAADAGPLTLRVNDATVPPGGILAVVVRTYSPRGVGQGQICLGGPLAPVHEPGAERAAAGPLTELIEVRMWSDEGDVVLDASFDPARQELLVDFASASAGVNRSDGPMLAALFRIDPALPPGTVFTLGVDPATRLFDGDGQLIVTEPRAGEILVREPAAPIEVGADGGRAAPGEWAELSFATHESLALESGTVVLLYDPAIAADPSGASAQVSMSPLYGASTFQAISGPGRVEVSFQSADASLNVVPGELITVRFQVAPEVAVPSSSPVMLGDETQLVTAGVAAVDLVLGDGAFDFVPRQELALFADGFESGGLDGWCEQAP